MARGARPRWRGEGNEFWVVDLDRPALSQPGDSLIYCNPPVTDLRVGPYDHIRDAFEVKQRILRELTEVVTTA